MKIEYQNLSSINQREIDLRGKIVGATVYKLISRQVSKNIWLEEEVHRGGKDPHRAVGLDKKDR